MAALMYHCGSWFWRSRRPSSNFRSISATSLRSCSVGAYAACASPAASAAGGAGAGGGGVVGHLEACTSNEHTTVWQVQQRLTLVVHLCRCRWRHDRFVVVVIE